MTALIGIVAYQQATNHIANRLNQDITQLSETLSNELERFSQLPVLLASDPRLQRFLTAPFNPSSTNELLYKWQQTLEADVIYLIDHNGLTLAASNSREDTSFVGHNFQFRPYFQQAMSDERGQYFALGIQSNRRGYYFSAPIRRQGVALGVLVIKVDLSAVEELWRYQTSDYLIVDQNGVVFYSSKPEYLYHSLLTLDETTKQSIIDSRQYGRPGLLPLTQATHLDALQSPLLALRDNESGISRHISQSFPMPQIGWQIFGVSPVTNAWQVVGQAIVIFMVFYLLICLAAASWFETYSTKQKLSRLNSRLEHLVRERTDKLQLSNQQLRETLRQYEHSQHALKQTERELIQAAKLAMLGELSASINHEINQPLAAIRTYAENAQRFLDKGNLNHVGNNLAQIVELNEMITEIIARLKVFARKQDGSHQGLCDVESALHSAISIVNARLLKAGIVVKLDATDTRDIVNIDAVQLEQIIINLLTNAAQALASHPSPRIGITPIRHQDWMEIQVWDNGDGVENPRQIFDPFYTSKPDGLGLGLTISKRIIEDFGGAISVSQHTSGGACFHLRIPLSKEETR
nr:ATP-binding protein [Thaumasiovibrio subtropicus]